MDDLRVARGTVALFNAPVVVQLSPGTKLRRFPARSPWLITRWRRSFARKAPILLLLLKLSIIVFHALCIEVLLRSELRTNGVSLENDEDKLHSLSFIHCSLGFCRHMRLFAGLSDLRV